VGIGRDEVAGVGGAEGPLIGYTRDKERLGSERGELGWGE